MDKGASTQRLLASLERLLQIPTGNLQSTLVQASDVIAEAFLADKVDVFLYDSTRDSLNAIGSSTQPLSAKQRKLGLEVLPVSNGGRVVWVYKTGQTFATGNLQEDPEELRGVKEALGIRSTVGIPLEVGGRRRGMVMIASLEPDHFTGEDVQCAETLVRWTGVLAHRAELTEETRRNSMEQSRRATADELIAIVAHDLRNYLVPIEVRLQTLRMLLTGSARPEAALEEVARIVKSFGQIRRLVSDLLDAARLDHGLFRVDPAVIDLLELVEDAARALARPDIRVDVRVQSMGRILVCADATRIRQCIDNLLANAFEQSPNGGTVSVVIATETRETGEHARVQVIDEGPGVPAEILPHIFERHTTSKAGGGGLGLGLFLAKRIIELHGGSLWVDSNPGRGACFTLSLPCHLDGHATAISADT